MVMIVLTKCKSQPNIINIIKLIIEFSMTGHLNQNLTNSKTSRKQINRNSVTVKKVPSYKRIACPVLNYPD